MALSSWFVSSITQNVALQYDKNYSVPKDMVLFIQLIHRLRQYIIERYFGHYFGCYICLLHAIVENQIKVG